MFASVVAEFGVISEISEERDTSGWLVEEFGFEEEIEGVEVEQVEVGVEELPLLFWKERRKDHNSTQKECVLSSRKGVSLARRSLPSSSSSTNSRQ